MILRLTVKVRENDPWPSGGETSLRLKLEQELAQAAVDAIAEARASLQLLEFTKGRS